MILYLHVIFPQGYGTHAQRSASCLAILLPGLTTSIFYMDHRFTCLEAQCEKLKVELEFTVMT